MSHSIFTNPTEKDSLIIYGELDRLDNVYQNKELMYKSINVMLFQRLNTLADEITTLKKEIESLKQSTKPKITNADELLNIDLDLYLKID